MELTKKNEEIQQYDNEQLGLIKSQFAQNTTDAELKLFLYMSQKYQLDILTRQIWCVKFGNKPAQLYAGRDGFLSIAHRSGKLDGFKTTVRIEQIPLSVSYYDKKQSKWKKLERSFQYVATCEVFRKDMANPFVSEVWEEEYSTGRDLWQTKPRTMISKVAESQALRKAFDISGLYAPEELPEPQNKIDVQEHEVVEGNPSEPPVKPEVNQQNITDNEKAEIDKWFSKIDTPERMTDLHNYIKTQNVRPQIHLYIDEKFREKENEKKWVYNVKEERYENA